jgi:DtxR family Mn-dependent transcriptional regulator
MNSLSEENYLKSIYLLGTERNIRVTTNNIAEQMNTKASSVTDMMKKLSEKGLLNYARYQGVSLTEEGRKAALSIVRKHRLWEVFLVEKLGFRWDEVHEIAEELEHIRSELLVDRLQDFLGNPSADPHGDAIPDKNGKFYKKELTSLSKMTPGASGTISGVREHSTAFLQYLGKTGLTLGKTVCVQEIIEFDGSMILTVDKERELTISRDVAKNVLIYHE